MKKVSSGGCGWWGCPAVGWEEGECPVGFICLIALISSFAVCRIINNRMCLLIIQVIDDLIHQLFLLFHQ